MPIEKKRQFNKSVDLMLYMQIIVYSPKRLQQIYLSPVIIREVIGEMHLRFIVSILFADFAGFCEQLEPVSGIPYR